MAVNITGLSSEGFSNIVEEVGTNVIITNNKIVGYQPNIHSKTNAAVAVQEYTEDQNDVRNIAAIITDIRQQRIVRIKKAMAKELEEVMEQLKKGAIDNKIYSLVALQESEDQEVREYTEDQNKVSFNVDTMPFNVDTMPFNVDTMPFNGDTMPFND
jgi:hypothetical protein